MTLSNHIIEWLEADQNDYCCCLITPYKVDPEKLLAWYRCPICGEEHSVGIPPEPKYDPADFLRDERKDR